MTTQLDATKTTGVMVSPETTVQTVGRHMLLDRIDIVVDLQRSSGSYIVDARSGKRYLDFFTFVASSPIGLNHPKLTTPEFLERLGRAAVNKPSNSDIYTTEQAEFVSTFARIGMPETMRHLFLIDGGALAVENALKAAFDWKVKKNLERGYKEEKGTKVLHFRQAFHGRSGYTMSMTNGSPLKIALYPKFDWPRVSNPVIRFPLNEENLTAVKKAEEQSLSEIRESFRRQKDDIAAIILEPIQGEGGDNHFRPEFFQALRALADENEAMLIMDEVQTGVGLTGAMWAYQHYGFEPDIVVFGKKMQVCGVLCGSRIDEVKENVFAVSSRINSTWGGNLVDMVRATKYLEVIEEDDLIGKARIMGEFLLGELEALVADFPALISNARGKGLFAAFDLNDPEKRKPLRDYCFDHGLIILLSGDRSIRFRPALTVSQDELEEGLRIIREGLRSLT